MFSPNLWLRLGGAYALLFSRFLPISLLSLFAMSSFSSEPPALTLTEASHLAWQNNPALQVFGWRLKAIDASRLSADQSPEYEVGIEAENVLGSGSLSGIDSAEFTLSLSSVIELGGKRPARVAVASSRYALAEAERQAAALDLLGQVTQRFISALAVQEKLAVADAATALAESSYALVNDRVKRGASPTAERLRAQSALIQAQLRQKALAAELTSQKYALATLWGAENLNFGQLEGDLFLFQKTADFNDLYERAVQSPAIQVFASESRIRDAEVELSRSQSSNNVRWSLGAKRLEESGYSAFTVGVSMPLFSARRNSGEVQSAIAQRESVNMQKEDSLLALRARLFTAWQTHQQSAAAAQELRTDVLPILESALNETRVAYERGRYSYLDWVSAQQELLDARLMVIDAASTALLNQALIEQLTAQPLGN